MSASHRPLEPWRLIPAALSAGALSAADVVHTGVQVDQVGRSHPVYRFTIGGSPRFFVKCFGPWRGSTDGTADRERAVLRLATELPAVAALTPPPWPWNDDPPAEIDDEIISTAAVPGGPVAPGLGAEPGSATTASGADQWDELVDALVPPLAAFHRATRHLARPGAEVPDAFTTAPPWGLCLMDGDAAPELWASPTTGPLLRRGAADPDFVAGLRAARHLWRPLTLIHADLKPDNVLRLAGRGTPEIRAIDWEMARLGDPAWDLAMLAASVATAGGDGPPWTSRNVQAVALLASRYSAASGLSPAGLGQRIAHYTGAVLAMNAVQMASILPLGADPSAAVEQLNRARATIARAEDLGRLIAGGPS